MHVSVVTPGIVASGNALVRLPLPLTVDALEVDTVVVAGTPGANGVVALTSDGQTTPTVTSALEDADSLLVIVLELSQPSVVVPATGLMVLAGWTWMSVFNAASTTESYRIDLYGRPKRLSMIDKALAARRSGGDDS